MTPVIIESPYKEFDCYAQACFRDSLDRGEAPIAPYRVYAELLAERPPSEQASAAALVWTSLASKIVVYSDRGLSPGMRRRIKAAAELGLEVEYRVL